MTNWTEPKTWVNDQPLTADDLNTHLRDNLLALKEPPTAIYQLDESADYSTTVTDFVDVDPVKLALTLTTSGGDVLIGFGGLVQQASGTVGRVYFDVAVDGQRIGTDDGLIAVVTNANDLTGDLLESLAFTVWRTNLPAGVHTFTLQWKTNGADYLLLAGPSSPYAIHPQFWAREIS